MAGHAQLKCVMTECSKTHIRLKGLILSSADSLYDDKAQGDKQNKCNNIDYDGLFVHFYDKNIMT